MYVIEYAPDLFVQATGNPVLTSLDGEVVAPLATILHESWTEEDRAKFGVFAAVPFVEPEGYRKVGAPSYTRDEDGGVYETYAYAPLPPAKPERNAFAELDALKARLDALEAKA